jgi:hypothetical protein
MTTTEEMMMTDHTEMQIPDDVMEAAKEAHANYAKSSVTDNLTVIIARAILAERERCARIADRNDMSAWGIAREIRSVDK